MRIKLLQKVEDANEFTTAELAGLSPELEHSITVSPITVGSTVVGIYRVDKIPEGAEVDVPVKQAENLMALGLATLVLEI